MERAKRLGLRIAMVVVALNVWTGSPLLALWIGSRLQGSGPPRMGPVFVVVVTFAALSFALAMVLARLGEAYDRMTGQTVHVQRHVAWLRSMRGERPQYPGQHVQVTALEQVLIVVVVVCVLAFEIWFFFFSTSPIDQRSGRGSFIHRNFLADAQRLPAPARDSDAVARQRHLRPCQQRRLLRLL